MASRERFIDLKQMPLRPNAEHYFATYLDLARIIKLHFERFNCEGRQMYRDAGLCLHDEFTLSGSHYRQTKKPRPGRNP